MLACTMVANSQVNQPVLTPCHQTLLNSKLNTIKKLALGRENVSTANFNQKKVSVAPQRITYQADGAKQLMDSTHSYSWGINIKGWKSFIGGKTIYTYNANNIMIGKLSNVRSTSTGTWETTSRIINTLDANENIINSTTQHWDGGVWVNYIRDIATFDANNNQTSTISQQWDTNISAWVNNSTYNTIYTFDANKNQTGSLRQRWDTSTNKWVNEGYSSSFTYDTNKNVTNSSEVEWANGIIISGQQNLSVYDNNNNETSQINQTWDTSSKTWLNTDKTTYTYDVNKSNTSLTMQKWTAGAWLNDTQYSNIIWTSQGKETIALSYDVMQWVNNSWSAIGKCTSTLDAYNNVTSQLQQDWDGSKSAWVNSSQDISTYDVNNNLTSDLYQRWNNTTGVWDNDYLNTWTYDANNYLTSEGGQSWNSLTSKWEMPSHKTIDTFDANHNKTNSLDQTLDTVTNTLVNYIQSIYTFDEYNNQTSYVYQFWDAVTGAWVNQYNKTIQTYDANHNKTSDISQEWNIISSTWVNNYKMTTNYDTNNLIDNTVYISFDADGKTVDYGDSTLNFYRTVINAVQNIKTAESEVSVFPNPSNGKFIISSPESSINAVEIFNLLGDKVYSNANQSAKSEINLSTAAKGVYLLKINNGTKSNGTKIVIQ